MAVAQCALCVFLMFKAVSSVKGSQCSSNSSWSKPEDLPVYTLLNETVEISVRKQWNYCVWDVNVLKEMKNLQIESSNRTLVQIHPFSHALNGTEVWCQSKKFNNKGRSQRNYKAILLLGEKPNIRLLDQVVGSLWVKLNQLKKFCFRVSGEPPPNVEASLMLNSLRGERRTFDSSQNGCLPVRLKAGSDSGEITVVASNCFGNTSVTVQVAVATKPTIVLNLPDGKTDVRASVNQSVVISYQVSGRPRPKVWWFKRHESERWKAVARSLWNNTHLSLSRSSVDKESNWSFRIVARNSAGVQTIKVFRLSITKPSVAERPFYVKTTTTMLATTSQMSVAADNVSDSSTASISSAYWYMRSTDPVSTPQKEPSLETKEQTVSWWIIVVVVCAFLAMVFGIVNFSLYCRLLHTEKSKADLVMSGQREGGTCSEPSDYLYVEIGSTKAKENQTSAMTVDLEESPAYKVTTL